MKITALTILSKTSLALGYASIVGSAALWAAGRMRGDERMQHDGLFVGLWVPSFFILSNRYENLAQETLEQEELFLRSPEAQDTIQGRLTTNKNLPDGWREEVEEASKSAPTQSPRPLQHTRTRSTEL